MESSAALTGEAYDMIIIGAGISGINTAYRMLTELPNWNFTILEARNSIGGTWDLFRYPGIRSDSDLHTFGFDWRRWDNPKTIASGADIKKYIEESAAAYGIDEKVLFNHVVEASYYDYARPLQADIPGIQNFGGQTIHPQFWPQDLKLAGKRVVVIGSGATAITIIPNIVEEAEKVTMLQRSPSYIMAQPAVDPIGKNLKKVLPKSIAHSITRWMFIILPLMFFQFCHFFPTAARKVLRKAALGYLPKNVPHDPHFNPRYNPWEQRLCVSPDGDFYKCLGDKAEIVTDAIQVVKSNGIQTKEGKFIPADIIITATGLRLLLAGGSRVSVDGNAFVYHQHILWRGVMLTELPNTAFVIGYTNASWTLGADVTALHIIRLLKYMDSKGYTVATPKLTPELVSGPKSMKLVSSINLNSTYVEKAKGALPMAGDRAPWLPRTNFISDKWNAMRTSLTDSMDFRAGTDRKMK